VSWFKESNDQRLNHSCLLVSHPIPQLGLIAARADVRENKNVRARSGAGCQKKVVIGRGGLIFLGPQFGKAKADCYHHCDSFILTSLS